MANSDSDDEAPIEEEEVTSFVDLIPHPSLYLSTMYWFVFLIVFSNDEPFVLVAPNEKCATEVVRVRLSLRVQSDQSPPGLLVIRKIAGTSFSKRDKNTELASPAWVQRSTIDSKGTVYTAIPI